MEFAGQIHGLGTILQLQMRHFAQFKEQDFVDFGAEGKVTSKATTPTSETGGIEGNTEQVTQRIPCSVSSRHPQEESTGHQETNEYVDKTRIESESDAESDALVAHKLLAIWKSLPYEMQSAWLLKGQEMVEKENGG